MQEKRKRSTDAGADATHGFECIRISSSDNSIGRSRSSSCSSCAAYKKKRQATPEWGPPSPSLTEERHVDHRGRQRELLNASDVGKLQAAKESATTNCDRRLSLLAFSRSPAEDEVTRVERRLQKLWRGKQEEMISNRGPISSSSSRTTIRPRRQTLELKDTVNPGETNVTTTLARDFPKRGAQDWQPSVARTRRVLSDRSPGGDVAMRVIAVRSLWTNITDFMIGLPFAVLQFEKQAAPKYSSTRRQAGYKSKVFFPLHVVDDWFPKYQGWLPQLAIAEDNLKTLQMLHQLRQSSHYRANPKLGFGQVMRCAIWYKRWQILKWLCQVLPRDSEWRWEPDLMSYAISHRNFSLMNWLFEICPEDSIKLSARKVEIEASGDLEMVRWLHEHHYEFSVWMMSAAAAKGSLEVVRFLHEHRSEGCTTDAMDLAARYGHLHVVEFLHANRTEGCTSSALEGAAQSGHLDIVKFLRERRTEDSTAAA